MGRIPIDSEKLNQFYSTTSPNTQESSEPLSYPWFSHRCTNTPSTDPINSTKQLLQSPFKMHFSLASIAPAAILLMASTAQACLNFGSVTSYDNGQMDGGTTDDGVHTCTINTIPGFSGGTASWSASCIGGYSMTVTNKGADVAYCNPSRCFTFSANCNFDSDAIRCNANVFGC